MEIGDKLIVSVHEPYWEIPAGIFCTLKPIVDIVGNDVDPNECYNRGRIWWKIRPEDRNFANIGRLISVEIEEAFGFDKSDPNKDFYQVQYGSVTGAENYIAEIIQMDDSVSQTNLIETGHIRCDHPIRSGVVFCKTGSYVLGPFTCSCNDQLSVSQNDVLLNLTPGLGVHALRRMELEEFVKYTQPQTINLKIYTETHERSSTEIEYRFFPKERLDNILTNPIGTIIDHRSDKQVVSEVIKDLKWKRADRQGLLRLLDEINQADLNLDKVHKNKERIQKIVRKIDSCESVLDGLVDEIIEEKKFQSLLEDKIKFLSGKYIDEHKKSLEYEASEKIHNLKKEISELEKEFKDLEDVIEEEKKIKIQETEQALNRKKAEADALFLKREEEIVKKEEEFLGKQEYLSQLVKRLNENRDEIVAQLFGLLPILQEMGFSASKEYNTPQKIKEGKRDMLPASESAFLLYKPLQTKDKPSESDFINRFIKLTEDCGFSYNELDLKNFHVCTKSANFNILTGPSGIGKSSLPRFYSQALHGSADGKARFLMVAVKPGWLDSQELIGHFNSLEGRFQPASSGFYQFLVSSTVEAIEPASGVYICCLDEMNLSYIEHYFADFLSLLQAPLNERVLKLFDKNLCTANDSYCEFGEIKLPRSIRFCGTVNIDETTKFFSPKVLDRVHIIEMSRLELSNLSSLNEQEIDPLLIGPPISERVYRSWIQDPGLVKSEVLKNLNEFDNYFSKTGLIISPRVYISICRYVANAKGIMSSEEAMDFAIFQKILPALRGHTQQFRDLLLALHELCKQKNYQKSASRLKLIAEAPVAMDFFNYTLV